jgi:endonuclease/exonuclease/phosphatase family metal-dependent hydrolase
MQGGIDFGPMLRALSVLYAIVLAVALVLLYPLGDRIWPSTLLLLGPRWVLALPWPVLAAAALWRDRRLLLLLVPLGLVLLVGVLGFRAPVRSPFFETSEGRDLRVMSYNIGGGPFDAQAFRRVLEESLPDVVALQECKDDLHVPVKEWTTSSQLGSCVLSRFPLRDIAVRPVEDVWRMAGSGMIIRHAVDTPAGTVYFTNIHLETPREGLEELWDTRGRSASMLRAKNAQREIEARLARHWVDESPGPARIVAGDFNMTVESAVFREQWEGYRDAFSESGLGFGFSKHTRLIGVRIDHVLAGPGWLCVKSWVGPSLGHDHRPVLAVLRWQGPDLPRSPPPQG